MKFRVKLQNIKATNIKACEIMNEFINGSTVFLGLTRVRVTTLLYEYYVYACI